MLPEFKKRIDSLRDTLVGAVPSPAGQIEQITYALIYKFMSDIDDKTASIGGKRTFFTGEYEKYGWHELMSPTVGAHDRLMLYREALGNLSKNPGLPKLFQDIYQNAYLTFNDSRVLTLFLKGIDNFKHSNSDDIGDAYEYLLQITGAQGDVGQFRTPRHIIKFIVEAVNPTKDDSVLDPAVGTAGFLIAAYNHVKHHHDGVDEITGLADEKEQRLTSDELDKLHKNYRGFDIDSTMVRTSMVNMYLHGFKTPDIKNHDSLSNEDWWNERYDVILANPPFMSPKGGIKPHDKFGIVANRAEVLFVDYITSHLKPTGRAGIVVPEGIIFQSGKAYKELRKNLVDNYLYAVVSLPAGVFQPYSGVKTSILLIDKELAKQHKEVLFVKIENDGYSLGAQRRKIAGNHITEALELIKSFKKGAIYNSELGHAVSRKLIAESGEYNLGGDRYITHEQINSSHNLVEFDEIFEFSGKDRAGQTSYPVMSITMHNGLIDQGDRFKSQIASKDTSKYKIVYKNELVVGFPIDEGVLGFQTKYDAAIVSPAYDIWKLKTTVANEQYLEKILRSESARKMYARNMQGAVSRRRSIPRERMRTLKIPLPSIDAQHEIVTTLNGYQKIVDAARTIIKTYKPTIKTNPEWRVEKIIDVVELNPQKKEVNALNTDTLVSFVPMAQLSESNINFREQESKKIGDVIKGYTYFADNDVLLAKVTPCFENGKSGVARELTNGIGFGSSEFYVLRPKDSVLSEWVYYFISNVTFIEQGKTNMTGTGGLQRLTKDYLLNTFIPIPSINEQREIIAQLESEQGLIDVNKKLIEIYTQKIKTKIAEVWGE